MSCWHFLRTADTNLFLKAARVALIVAVPITLLQLVVGTVCQATMGLSSDRQFLGL